jgi:iron complex transport system permease protein
MISSRVLLTTLFIIAALTFAGAITMGSAPVGWRGLWAVTHDGGTSLQRTILLEVRLPRAIAAFVVGAIPWRILMCWAFPAVRRWRPWPPCCWA